MERTSEPPRPGPTASITDAEDTASRESVRPCVLIAEDNWLFADVLRFNLSLAGFDVTAVENGRLAVQELGEKQFDLLIVDLQMPELDGEGVCRTVREQLKLAGLPIVVCSAKGLELDVNWFCQTYGVSKILFKPFSPREVVALAESLVSASFVNG